MAWAVIACAALCTPPAGAADAERGGPTRTTPAHVAPPNDPLFRFQWHLPAIGIPAAWAVSRGSGAVVAVLDTGVAYKDRGRHRQAPDLAGTRFVAGWDFVDDDPYPDDVPPSDGRRSHGTLMAGLIAQTTGNAIGGAGVAPAAAIMPVRVLEADLRGSARALARGVRFAVDHGADVISLSLAGPSPVPEVHDAIKRATARGVTVVAATGNEGYDVVSWPAAYPQVIAVGAVRRDLKRASYSNHGRELDLVAPGGAGERFDNGRGSSDGVLAQALIDGPGRFCFCYTASTSAAAAQVAGVAALVVGAEPAIEPAALRARLLAGARDLGPRGHDAEYGAGLVQAQSALRIARPEVTRSLPPPRGSARPSAPEHSRWRTLGLGALGAAILIALALTVRRRFGHTA